MSIHNNLDTGTICLWQADATVLSRRGSYFYFSMRAVKASQNKQTQVKLLLLFFLLLPAPCSLGEQHCSCSQQGALMGRCSAKGQLPFDGPHMFIWKVHIPYYTWKASQTINIVHFSILESSIFKGCQDPLPLLHC